MAKIPQSISWQAEEYFVKDHSALWYIGLLVVSGALSLLAVFRPNAERLPSGRLPD